MNDFVVLGTDTDAGKTTFCLLWLAAFADFEYWKPVETGPSDSERVAALVPCAKLHAVVKRFSRPVAPPLAAQMEGDCIPSAAKVAMARPEPASEGHALLIETFGSPFSPLNQTELQIRLIESLAAGRDTVLVSSSKIGAVGRTLACLHALRASGIIPLVILMGDPDPFAEQRLAELHQRPVFSLRPPSTWTIPGVAESARSQGQILKCIRNALGTGKDDNSRERLVARDRASIWHPYTSLREADDPLPCIGAEDEFLILEDGRRLIDGISSWWTILHGHRYAPLMNALFEAAARFDHVLFAGITHRPAVELAELLLSTSPWRAMPTPARSERSTIPSIGAGVGMPPPAESASEARVFYSDNGSTAVEVALKMAYQFWCHRGEPQRTRFIGFEGGYHGDTFGAMAVGRDPVFFARFEPLLFHADILPLSPERLDEALARAAGQISAVILEPLVQGAGGMRMHSPSMLRKIFEVTRAHDVLFIADEVMTGGGRTGTLWAHQAAGIAPDLICAGKTLAGGVLPLAATLAAPHVVAAWRTDDPSKTFFHGHSFTAHPLACAVAAANWKLLAAQPVAAPVRMERFWNSAFAGLGNSPKVREIRIKGTIAAVEVNAPGGYLADVGRRMRRHCLNEGVLLRPLGPVLYAMPPFRTSQESLERIAGAMIHAVEECI